MKLTGRMQTDKGDITTVGRKELPHFILLATDRHYMVVRAIKDTEESLPGIYRSAESWTTSFFYISDLGVNYWIGLQRFTSEVSQWRQNFRRGIRLPQPHIPEPGWQLPNQVPSVPLQPMIPLVICEKPNRRVGR